jgi:hypothetical protein
MTTTTETGDLPGSRTSFLVEFPPRAGLKDVTSKPEALSERSATAMNAAMSSIRDVADRVNSTVTGLIRQPEEVEVEFGIKLDAEVGALIAKTRVEAHMMVTLKWTRDQGDGHADGQAQ